MVRLRSPRWFFDKKFSKLEEKIKMAGKLVITTGSSRCGRKELFLPGFEKYCAENGTKVKIYNVGDMIFPWAWYNIREELNRDTILDVNPLAVDIIHAAVLRDIHSSLKKDLEENDAVLINLHTIFIWRDVWNRVFNELFIRELIEDGLSPDMFICFIDLAEDILKRLNETDQWRGQKLTEDNIWSWENEEANNTKALTYLFDEKKKFFVMPAKQPPETLYYLLFEPQRPVVYAQMPITHVTAQDLKRVKQFIEKLRKWAVVFDPLTIETGPVERAEGDNEQIRVRHNQTAYRDVGWFIPQSDVCIAYYVKVVFSAGVVDETATASQLGKQTWVVFPKDYSPFIHFRATPNRIFQTPEEVLEFAEKEFIPWWTKKWQEKYGEKTVSKEAIINTTT